MAGLVDYMKCELAALDAPLRERLAPCLPRLAELLAVYDPDEEHPFVVAAVSPTNAVMLHADSWALQDDLQLPNNEVMAALAEAVNEPLSDKTISVMLGALSIYLGQQGRAVVDECQRQIRAIGLTPVIVTFTDRVDMLSTIAVRVLPLKPPTMH